MCPSYLATPTWVQTLKEVFYLVTIRGAQAQGSQTAWLETVIFWSRVKHVTSCAKAGFISKDYKGDNMFVNEWFAGINCIIFTVEICDRKMIQFMPTNHSNTNRVITILIHSDKMHFQNLFVMLLCRFAADVTSPLHKRYDFNAPNFDVIANENACYKRNELECNITQTSAI